MVLWVVFSLLFFKEIWKNGTTRGHGYMSASAEGKQKKSVRQLQCEEQYIDHIPITFRDCRVHIFPTTFLEIAVYILAYWKLIKTISTHAYNQSYSPQEQIIYNGRHALKAKLQTTELNLRQFTILVLGTQSKGRSTGIPNSIICERMLKIITSANT